MSDWSTLLTPLIIALVPILVALMKRVIPDRYAWIYPLLATALGPVLEALSAWALAQPASPGRGLLLGMAGVAVREIQDQLRKIPTGPTPAGKAGIPLLAGLLAAGCAGPFGMTGMNAEQLREWAKVKDANATCVRGVYAGAMVTAISISADKGIPAGVTIDADCKVTLTTTGAPAR